MFIKLTVVRVRVPLPGSGGADVNNIATYFNSGHIINFRKDRKGTKIEFSNGDWVVVSETDEEIFAVLNN